MLTIENIGKLKGWLLVSPTNSTRWHCDMVAGTNESYGFQFRCIGTALVRMQHLVNTTTVVELNRKMIYDSDFPKDTEHNCVYEIKNMRTGDITYAKSNDINTIDKFSTWLCQNTL